MNARRVSVTDDGTFDGYAPGSAYENNTLQIAHPIESGRIGNQQKRSSTKKCTSTSAEPSTATDKEHKDVNEF